MRVKHLLIWCFCFGLLGCGNRPNSGVVTFNLDDTTSVALKTSLPEKGEEIVISNGGENVVLSVLDKGSYSVPVFGGSINGEWIDGVYFGFWTDSLRPNNYTVSLNIKPRYIGSPCDTPFEKTAYNTTLGLLLTETGCDSVYATFLTPTGDYRYLSGTNKEGVLSLNTFDGAHLFSFTAKTSGDSLVDGVFKSGTHYREFWSGVKTPNPTPLWSSIQAHDSKSEYEFTATTTNGKSVVVDKGVLESSGKKLLVMDVLGTWCPNCYDEVRLLKELSNTYPQVLFLSVAFERGDKDRALRRISSFKEEQGIGWEVLYGGVSSKQLADSVIPFLGGINSFPTTLFYPIDGEPVVHTGFSGPATPNYSKEVEFYKNVIEGFIE